MWMLEPILATVGFSSRWQGRRNVINLLKDDLETPNDLWRAFSKPTHAEGQHGNIWDLNQDLIPTPPKQLLMDLKSRCLFLGLTDNKNATVKAKTSTRTAKIRVPRRGWRRKCFTSPRLFAAASVCSERERRQSAASRQSCLSSAGGLAAGTSTAAADYREITIKLLLWKTCLQQMHVKRFQA